MKKPILSITVIWLLLNCMHNTGTVHETTISGTNDETIVRTGAVIYEQDGITPANGAIIKVFKADAIDGQYLALRVTDSDGQFLLKDLEPGHYNIWVEKDSMVAFQDSIYITNDGAVLKDDTLDCASSLTGQAGLQSIYEPGSVSIQVIGTDKCLTNLDSSGRFTIRGMAGGNYSLLLKSDLPGCLTATQKVNVHSCTNDTLRDTIWALDCPR